jgi:hypothetical protein
MTAGVDPGLLPGGQRQGLREKAWEKTAAVAGPLSQTGQAAWSGRTRRRVMCGALIQDQSVDSSSGAPVPLSMPIPLRGAGQVDMWETAGVTGPRIGWQ